MEEKNHSKGTIKELYSAFTAPLSTFFKRMVDYIFTSLMVFSFKKLPGHISKPDKQYLKDVDYSLVTLEILIILIFIAKIANVGEESGELFESFRDLIVLVLFFITLLIFIGVSRLWAFTTGINQTKREIDAFFIYEFNFLFLPSYFFIYPVYLTNPDDDDMVGGVVMLFGLFWLLHMAYYFFRLSRFYKLSTLSTLVSTVVLPVVGFVLLFVSLSILVGAAVAAE